MSQEKYTIILQGIHDELRHLRPKNDSSSMFLELFLAGVGSSLNLTRCIHTLLASGADPRAIRHHVSRHLRRSMASEAALMQELADAPDRPAAPAPGETDDFVERVTGRILSRVRDLLAAEDTRPVRYEVRLTPEEAAAGCVIALAVGDGPAVDLGFPPGTDDGQRFYIEELTTAGKAKDGDPWAPTTKDVVVVARVIASRASARKPKSGRVNGQHRYRDDEPMGHVHQRIHALLDETD